nr:GNAT family N-acetyltransferase [Allomuricauda sp.]
MYKSLDFHDEVLLADKVHELWDSFHNTYSGKLLYKTDIDSSLNSKPVFYIKDVPDYLSVQYPSELAIKTIKTFDGTLINCTEYPNYESYVKANFDGKRKAQFNSLKQRLEHCFDIRHVFYYGKISRREYETLFEQFKKLLKIRFQQKEVPNDSLALWNSYYESAYNKILQKKACLSVIYHGDKAIALSLNFILDRVIFGFIKTYDISYSKFGLGFTENLNMIQWAFENGFEVFDFLKGDDAYKSRFTTNTYTFEKHLVCPKKDFKARALTTLLFVGMNTFYFIFNKLKYIGLHKIWRSIYGAYYRVTSRSTIETDELRIDSLNTEVDDLQEHHQINVDEILSPILRKSVYDFCFKHKEILKNVQILKLKHKQDEILILGEFNQARIKVL